MDNISPPQYRGPGGSMRACHAAGPGSIPGLDKFPGWGFSSPVRQMSGSFRPPNIIWPSLSSSIIIHYGRQWPEMLTCPKTWNIHTTISNPVEIHTQSHQIPFQNSCLCHSQTARFHPWPHSPPIWKCIPTGPPIISHHQTSHLLTPLPSSIPAPVALMIFCQSYLLYCWRRPQCRLKSSLPFQVYQLLSAGPMMLISCLR